MSKCHEIWFPCLKLSALKVLSLPFFEFFTRKTYSIWAQEKIMGTHTQTQFYQNWPGLPILKQCLLDSWESGLSNGVWHVSWHFETTFSWNNRGVSIFRTSLATGSKMKWIQIGLVWPKVKLDKCKGIFGKFRKFLNNTGCPT